MNRLVFDALLANGSVEDLKAVLVGLRKDQVVLSKASSEVERQKKDVCEALLQRQEASFK